MQINCEQIRKKIRPDYLMTSESGLHRLLMERYEKTCAEMGAHLGKYYSQGVWAGLLIWCSKPDVAGHSSMVEDLILEIFHEIMKKNYPQLVEKEFSSLEKQAAEHIREELLEAGCPPEKVGTLEKIPLGGFRSYWQTRAAAYIREEVAQMVEEYNFWELLEDIPQLSKSARIKIRRDQLAYLRDPIERQLMEDRIKLSLKMLAEFSEHSYLAMFSNQLRLSLEKWEKEK